MALVLLDADGTILDCTTRTLQLTGSDRTVEDVTRWELKHLLLEWHGREHAASMFALWETPEFWRDQLPLPGAPELVQAVRDAGHRLKIVTAPWEPCATWEVCRKAALLRHFDVKSRDVVCTQEKDFIYGDLILEDHPKHLVEWERNWSGYAVLADMPYNRPTSSPAFEWPHRINIATDLERWKEYLDRLKYHDAPR